MNRNLTPPAPLNTKGLDMVVLFNNGEYHLYTPHVTYPEWSDDDGYDGYLSPDDRAEPTVEWKCCDNEYGWRAAWSREATEHKVLYVRGMGYSELRAHAATEAAAFAGIEIPNLDRHADGYFRCPHCAKRYDTLDPYRHHLGYDCGRLYTNDRSIRGTDLGAMHFASTNEFWQRNCGSRKTWLRLRTVENDAMLEIGGGI